MSKTSKIFIIILFLGIVAIGGFVFFNKNKLPADSSLVNKNVNKNAEKAIEKAISSKDGGSMVLNLAEGRLKIIFPQESLAEDSVIAVTPLSSAPINDPNILVNGFSLVDKKTGNGPSLKYPALLAITVNKDLPDSSSIIRYHSDDSGYDIIPTHVNSKPGSTSLVASLDHFSMYGVKKITDSEPIPSNEADYNWVIYIKDKTSFNNGAMKNSIKVDMKGINTSGEIAGNYSGTATALVTNDLTTDKGSMVAPATSNGTWNVNVQAYIGAAVEPEDPNLGSLDDPNNELDFGGTGTVTMASGGTATLTVPKGSRSGGFSNESSLPVTVTIKGPLVQLQVDFPQGPVYFTGFIRGEGK